ncbi:MAG: thioredoxin domain-containing protein [Chloroflexi bacterium]|nr:thioredoxin domain-containing protein [Chloroflexota bacterium]
MANRLAKETSPYLLQHADNPVDWYPWGEEAFDRARAEDKPVLLSIGYSACHWCHVMARESFENPGIARTMNEHFINIKVDREERPDVDSVYMEAVQAMTSSGGWPLTVFLTPDGKPFFGGTYFPPEDRPPLPAFAHVLRAVAEAYRQRRGEIEANTRQLEAAISRSTADVPAVEPLAAEMLSRAYSRLARAFDRRSGGFGTAPKFPQPMALEFLLRYFHRNRDNRALAMVSLTLENMARGGIHDQIGGGFHRYATDRRWLVPHFEKMLYDNALLSQLYVHAHLVTGKHLFRYIAERTLDYLLREMRAPEGGFYSSQDADSEGEEGKYYLWTPQEIKEVLGQGPGQVVGDIFGVISGGNFAGQNILHIDGEEQSGASSTIEQAREALLNRRERRVKPGRDEKVIAGWNGLALASLAEAACVLQRQDYLAAAEANGTFLLASMMDGGYFRHTYKDGVARIDGYLQDYATVIEGLLALHQATLDGKWLQQAIRLGEVMVEQFWNGKAGALYDTGPGHLELFIRPRSTFDGAMPSGPSAATLALLKLAILAGNQTWARIGAQSLRSMADLMVQEPLGFGHWLCGLDFYLSRPKEIVIVGPRDDPGTSQLVGTACKTWLPNKVFAALDPKDSTPLSELPLLVNRPMLGGRPTAYVCQGYACLAPVNEPAALAAQLKRA